MRRGAAIKILLKIFLFIFSIYFKGKKIFLFWESLQTTSFESMQNNILGKRANNILAINNFLFKKIGKPLFWSLPPGKVNTTANIMVTMRAPTTIQDVAVSFIHCSPSFLMSLWFFVNNSQGVNLSLFKNPETLGGTMLSTSCIC